MPRQAPANAATVAGKPVMRAALACTGTISGRSARLAMPASMTPSSTAPSAPPTASVRRLSRVSTIGASSGPASRAVAVSPRTPRSLASAALSASVSFAVAVVSRSLLRSNCPRASPDMAWPATLRLACTSVPAAATCALMARPPASNAAASPASSRAGSMRPLARNWPSRPAMATSASVTAALSGVPAASPSVPAAAPSVAAMRPSQRCQLPLPLAVTVNGPGRAASVVKIPPAGASNVAASLKRLRSGSASSCTFSVSPPLPGRVRACTSIRARPAAIFARPRAVIARALPAKPSASSRRPMDTLPMAISCSGSRRGSAVGNRSGQREMRTVPAVNSCTVMRFCSTSSGRQSSTSRSMLAKRPR